MHDRIAGVSDGAYNRGAKLFFDMNKQSEQKAAQGA
ncbi:MAG: hypothetical protein UY03_C0017G0017 [Parcubacteria group bacterium GW2011_GWA2_47_64]|nr:MAG: hypothetical protein UY03_C0017G0017 [Parcubacteria group bacterium GW2011_GWA2_47_64]